MSKRDDKKWTPRTCAAQSDGWSGDAWCVSAEFSKELERDLIDMEAHYWAERKANEKLRLENHALRSQLNKPTEAENG